MSHRRTLLLRWSREDRLAVLVIAVTVAFLVGTTLFVVAAGSQTAAIAADLDSPGSATHYASTDAAAAAAGPDDLVLPVAAVTGPDGDRTYAVGVPPGTDRAFGDRRLVAAGPTRGALEAPATHRLEGERAVSLAVSPRSNSILPPSWYATSPSTVEALGVTGALVIEHDPGGGEAALRGVLGFFTSGTEQLLGVVSVIVVAGGLLVGITAYSTSRMTVADRREALRVIRATGGRPRWVLGLFGLRAALIGGVGAALGYAIGVITANAAVSLAVAVGLPTSLTVAMTPGVAAFVAGLLAVMVVVAALGGLLAARRAATVPPSEIDAADTARGGRLSLKVLDRRALVPTAATLTAFLLVSSVVVAGGAVLAPVTESDRATIAEPGASHPVASQVPAGYVDGLEARGIDASGEILLFGVRNGAPLPMRGVDYGDYAAVTGARIVEGRPPDGPDEAVVGEHLGADVAVGDTITVGGSTRSAVTRVRVVGRYAAPGAEGGALLVSHRTARHLSTVRDGEVNVIRATRLPETGAEGLVVTDATVAGDPAAGDPVAVQVSVANSNPSSINETVTVAFADQQQRLAVSLAAGGTTRRQVTFDAVAAGSYELAAGDRTQRVTVQRRDQLTILGLPERAPPGSRPLVTVVDATGTPAATVTVRATDTARQTDANGTVRVPLNDTGTTDVTAGTGETAAATSVNVSADATRRLTADLTVQPREPDVLVRPTATLQLRNPWTAPRSAAATVRGPAGATERRLEVAPASSTSISRRLERQPPGVYNVTATLNGRAVATQRYRVRGDERIPAAVATSGRQGASPLGEAIEVAFGDLRLVAAALVGLAAMMTVGATTATFAATIRARRRPLGIYRATGAPPGRIGRLVVGDALRIGVVATAIASVLAAAGLVALDAAGVLTVFGVRLLPAIDPIVAVGVALTALAVVALSAGLATVAILRAPPADLVRDRSGGVTDD